MRFSGLHTAAAISAAAIVLSACYGGPQPTALGLPAALSPAHTARPSNVPHVLYVADDTGASTSDVHVLKYGAWTNLGTITNGIATPLGIWVDKNQSLYVANLNGSVTEYGSEKNLIFIYNSGLVAAAGVTTDSAGNVYITDSSAGKIVEFAQGNNSPVRSCSLGASASPWGVAVNAHGDVFVSLPNSGVIAEYPRGLKPSRCAAEPLYISFSLPYGIAFDKQQNLVVCEANASAVDIIAPPYATITGRLGSGYTGPLAVSINSAGTRAYVTDNSQKVVDVLTYPGGTNLATIGNTGGILDPTGAVDSKNYVP